MQLIDSIDDISFEKIIDLYDSVGWSIYTQSPDNLKLALNNSSYVIAATKNEQVIALARSISDDVSIHYLQDILVNPKFQGQGIGRKLINKCLVDTPT